MLNPVHPDTALLRVLEYYEGILILTTNRIKTFDLAVQSRVHLAVRYTDLSGDDKRKIFYNFLKRLNSDNTENLNKIERYVTEDFDEEFNGRQIRNVVSSAMAVARGRNGKITLRDIKDVVKVTRDFRNHLYEETVKARQRME